MSKRLQVVMDDAEWTEVEATAERQGLTISEWVRGVLRAARRQEPPNDVDRRLAVIRAAYAYAFPTGEMEEINAEIARGQSSGLPE